MNPTMSRLARLVNRPYAQFSSLKNPITTSLATTRVIHKTDPTCPAHTLPAYKSFTHVEDVVPASAGAASQVPKRRATLPRELLTDNVAVLTCESSAEGGDCDVHVVGTNHLSERSCREVAAIVGNLKPEVVFLELCKSRVEALKPRNSEELEIPTLSELVMLWWILGEHRAYELAACWNMAKAAEKLGVVPGGEFRAAYEEAIKYGGKVVLGDRLDEITQQRVSARLPLWHEIKLTARLLYKGIFLPSTDVSRKLEADVVDDAVQTLRNQKDRKECPILEEIIVDERDQIMSHRLQIIASKCSSVVAVVGQGHLSGIRKYWLQPVKDEKLFETLPTKRVSLTANNVKYFGRAVAQFAIISWLLSVLFLLNVNDLNVVLALSIQLQ